MSKPTLTQRLIMHQVACTTANVRGIRGNKSQNSGINFFGNFMGALAIFAVGFLFWMVTP